MTETLKVNRKEEPPKERFNQWLPGKSVLHWQTELNREERERSREEEEEEEGKKNGGERRRLETSTLM